MTHVHIAIFVKRGGNNSTAIFLEKLRYICATAKEGHTEWCLCYNHLYLLHRQVHLPASVYYHVPPQQNAITRQYTNHTISLYAKIWQVSTAFAMFSLDFPCTEFAPSGINNPQLSIARSSAILKKRGGVMCTSCLIYALFDVVDIKTVSGILGYFSAG